jgi:hypothetical protein
VARTLGLDLGTRRPPRVTEPASLPCRVAARFRRACLAARRPRSRRPPSAGPSPAAPHRPREPAAPRACRRRSRPSPRSPARAWRARSRRRSWSDTSWSRWSPVSLGRLWRTPNTYRKAGIRRGTATSSSTKPGTTSTVFSPPLVGTLSSDDRFKFGPGAFGPRPTWRRGAMRTKVDGDGCTRQQVSRTYPPSKGGITTSTRSSRQRGEETIRSQFRPWKASAPWRSWRPFVSAQSEARSLTSSCRQRDPGAR